MITTVTFTSSYLVFSYDFLHVRDHPVIGMSLRDGLSSAFREFRRNVKAPIWDFNLRLSKRP